MKTGPRPAYRDILYAPDFAINAGGLIYASLHHRHAAETTIFDQIDKIVTLHDIFVQARHTQEPTNHIANKLAEAKLYIPSPDLWQQPSSLDIRALH